MAKTILGVDIGQNQLKLALVKGNQVKKTISAEMPEMLVQDGRIVSVETMAELIRTTMREGHIRARDAAVVLSGDNVFVKSVVMPQMTAKQLEYNLPFEFRDYISGELKTYIFDYAMQSADAREEVPEEEEEQGKSMSLLAAAAPAEQMEELRASLRKSGLKMTSAAPAVCSYMALLAGIDLEDQQETCILDLGYSSIRMHVFRGTEHVVTRILEQGLSSLEQSLADALNIDVHLAHTYLLTNHDGCQRGEICTSVYGNIAVELMRALNFYRFSNPNSTLSGMWLCGGGANIAALKESIESTLDIDVFPMETLVPGGESIEDCAALAQAIGIAQN